MSISVGAPNGDLSSQQSIVCGLALCLAIDLHQSLQHKQNAKCNFRLMDEFIFLVYSVTGTILSLNVQDFGLSRYLVLYFPRLYY